MLSLEGALLVAGRPSAASAAATTIRLPSDTQGTYVMHLQHAVNLRFILAPFASYSARVNITAVCLLLVVLQQRGRRGRGTAATSHCAPDLSRRGAVAWTRWTIAPPPARTAQPPRRTLPPHLPRHVHRVPRAHVHRRG
jgi:hypothetical protein